MDIAQSLLLANDNQMDYNNMYDKNTNYNNTDSNKMDSNIIFAILADHQSAGRGKPGNVWHSSSTSNFTSSHTFPCASNFLCSFVLKNHFQQRSYKSDSLSKSISCSQSISFSKSISLSVQELSILFGIVVGRSIAAFSKLNNYNLDFKYKYPNDIFLNTSNSMCSGISSAFASSINNPTSSSYKKVGGILIEFDNNNLSSNNIVVGIGINLNHSPSNLLSTSIFENILNKSPKAPINPTDFLNIMIKTYYQVLYTIYECGHTEGDGKEDCNRNMSLGFAALEQEWKQNLLDPESIKAYKRNKGI